MTRRGAWLLVALAASWAAAAQTGWDVLPNEERALLAPWEARWDALEPAQREQLRRNTRHWLALDAAQRTALQSRLAAWDALPAAERARIREHAATWQQMSEEERAAVRASHARLQAMAPVERDAMRTAFDQLGTSERRALLVVGDERALAGVAQQAFAFVPPEERAATLDMLRAMPAAERERLATLARRIGPDERATLRRELLARPPPQRAAYVLERLDPR